MSGDLVGYIVAGYEHGKLVSDWDGEVHQTLDAGMAALNDCREFGYSEWNLYGLILVHVLPICEHDFNDMFSDTCLNCGITSTEYFKKSGGHRRLETVEQVEAMPVGSVLIDADGIVAERCSGGPCPEWVITGVRQNYVHRDFALPARVLLEADDR